MLAGHIRHGNGRATSVDQKKQFIERRIQNLDERINAVMGNRHPGGPGEQPQGRQHPNEYRSREARYTPGLYHRSEQPSEPAARPKQQPVQVQQLCRMDTVLKQVVRERPSSDIEKLYELVKSSLQSQNEMQTELRQLRKEFKSALKHNSQQSWFDGTSNFNRTSCMEAQRQQHQSAEASSTFDEIQVKLIMPRGKENAQNTHMENTVKLRGNAPVNIAPQRYQPLQSIDTNVPSLPGKSTQQKRTTQQAVSHMSLQGIQDEDFIQIKAIFEPVRGASVQKREGSSLAARHPRTKEMVLNQTLKLSDCEEPSRQQFEQSSLQNGQTNRQAIKLHLMNSTSSSNAEVNCRLAESAELYRDSEHKNAKHQHHHLQNTFDLQKKLRDDLLKRVYTFQDAKRYK